MFHLIHIEYKGTNYVLFSVHARCKESRKAQELLQRLVSLVFLWDHFYSEKVTNWSSHLWVTGEWVLQGPKPGGNPPAPPTVYLSL